MDSLPDELLLHILQYVTPFELKHFASLNSRYEKLILERTLWTSIDCSGRFADSREIDYFIEQIHSDTKTFRINGEPIDDPVYRRKVSLTRLESKFHYTSLTVLALEGIEFYQYSVLFKDYPKSLREVSFNESTFKDTDTFFRHAGHNLRRLRVITLEHCLGIADGIIMTLGNFPRLEIISLNGCIGIKDALVSVGLGSHSGFRRLQCLDVRCTGMGSTLLRTSMSMPLLAELYFHGYFHHVWEVATSSGGLAPDLAQLLRYRTIDMETNEGIVEAHDSSSVHQYTGVFDAYGIAPYRLRRFNGRDYVPPESVLYRRPYAVCTCGADSPPSTLPIANGAAPSTSGSHELHNDTAPSVSRKWQQEDDALIAPPSTSKMDSAAASISHKRNQNDADVTAAPSTSENHKVDNDAASSITDNRKMLKRHQDDEDLTAAPSVSTIPKVDNDTAPSTSDNLMPLECQNNDEHVIAAPSTSEFRKVDDNTASRKRQHSDDDSASVPSTSGARATNKRHQGDADVTAAPSVSRKRQHDAETTTAAPSTSAAPPTIMYRPNSAPAGYCRRPPDDRQPQQPPPPTSAGNGDVTKIATAFQPYFRLANGREVRGRAPKGAAFYAQHSGRVVQICIRRPPTVCFGMPFRPSSRFLHFCRVPPRPQDEQLTDIALRRLSLRGMPEIVDEMLPHLRHLDLELLDVTGTSVTPAGVALIRRTMPECRVLHESACRCRPR